MVILLVSNVGMQIVFTFGINVSNKIYEMTQFLKHFCHKMQKIDKKNNTENPFSLQDNKKIDKTLKDWKTLKDSQRLSTTERLWMTERLSTTERL